MLEKKFRAWFELEKKMVNHEDLALSYDGEDGFDFAFDKSLVDSEGNITGTLNFKLTQYTGLYDRNGVEIYEGDIVLVDDSWKGVVRYWQGCFMVDDDVLGAIHSFSEVIGNIYEKTELLEAAK